MTLRFVLLAATALLGIEACSVLPSTKRTANRKVSPPASATATASPASSCWPPWKILSRQRTPPPPKATPLLEVGTIRSISRDESFVIVELAPGTLVRTGDALLVTSTEHPASKLRVEEVQPPCFAAEVVEGSVRPGDVVKR